MSLPGSSFVDDLLVAHVCESKGVVTYIKDAEVVSRRHRQAFSRTDSCTESAKAALAHIDVERGGIDSF